MLGKLARKVIGSRNQRYLKSLRSTITEINSYEKEFKELRDEELTAKTAKFKERIKNGETINSLLSEAFAVCREASIRTLGLRHYDVQLIGGIVLHQGKIAEMRTGEGKTLVATLAIYLNALSGNGVHLITVNDYLAVRDAEYLRPLFEFLDLSIGVCVSDMEVEDKVESYKCDIIYGTNSEFGFDYLRSNMSLSTEDKIQNKLNFAIIDEVDSVLIDEARTPLIISGHAESDNTVYERINKVVPHLVKQENEDNPADYVVDEKDKNVNLTDNGHDKVEKLLFDAGLMDEGESIYNPVNISLFHILNACLRAHNLFAKDVDYIVDNGEIIIVDEFTGRTMHGRRWSEGLHQAIEAKEGLEIQDENQTVASITYQNFFRQYDKLAGMTGTADTEAAEFHQIYDLETIVIPTNLPTQRKDEKDAIYLNAKGKFNNVVKDIIEKNKKGQPALVGTTSIEISEFIGRELDKVRVNYEVLNAKQHEREAHIIENAGRKGAITIATNMAGRGTDIVLGGNLEAQIKALGENPSDSEISKVKENWKKDHDEVVSLGGLHIVGTERHESRRIDNQLRGRAGRQGDPGSSKFYLSMEDNLMRIFAGERMHMLMTKLGLKEDEAIESKLVSNSIESAQRKVEAQNFDMRKQLIDYDDVSNEQRKVVYLQRDEIMESEDISEVISNMREGTIEQIVNKYIPETAMLNDWDKKGLENAMLEFGLKISIDDLLKENDTLTPVEVEELIIKELEYIYSEKLKDVEKDQRKMFEKVVTLQIIDEKWRDHLKYIDYLRQGIGLRASRAQKDPRQEYKKEAFILFETLLDDISQEATKFFSNVYFKDDPTPADELEQEVVITSEEHNSVNLLNDNDNELQEVTEEMMIHASRNKPCPCGSGKKFKHCHGAI